MTVGTALIPMGTVLMHGVTTVLRGQESNLCLKVMSLPSYLCSTPLRIGKIIAAICSFCKGFRVHFNSRDKVLLACMSAKNLKKNARYATIARLLFVAQNNIATLAVLVDNMRC